MLVVGASALFVLVLGSPASAHDEPGPASDPVGSGSAIGEQLQDGVARVATTSATAVEITTHVAQEVTTVVDDAVGRGRTPPAADGEASDTAEDPPALDSGDHRTTPPAPAPSTTDTGVPPDAAAPSDSHQPQRPDVRPLRGALRPKAPDPLDAARQGGRAIADVTDTVEDTLVGAPRPAEDALPVIEDVVDLLGLLPSVTDLLRPIDELVRDGVLPVVDDLLGLVPRPLAPRHPPGGDGTDGPGSADRPHRRAAGTGEVPGHRTGGARNTASPAPSHAIASMGVGPGTGSPRKAAASRPVAAASGAIPSLPSAGDVAATSSRQADQAAPSRRVPAGPPGPRPSIDGGGAVAVLHTDQSARPPGRLTSTRTTQLPTDHVGEPAVPPG